MTHTVRWVYPCAPRYHRLPHACHPHPPRTAHQPAQSADHPATAPLLHPHYHPLPALWITLQLAALLAGEQLFAADYADGTLSQDRLHLPDLWLLLPAKLAAAWLRFTLPLLAILPLLALMLHIPATNIPATAALLALGSLPLLLIGALGAVLTLAQTHGTFLRFLIVVPLYIPILIIGVTAGHDNLLGLAIGGHYALLGAFSLFALITIIPFATLALKAQHLP